MKTCIINHHPSCRTEALSATFLQSQTSIKFSTIITKKNKGLLSQLIFLDKAITCYKTLIKCCKECKTLEKCPTKHWKGLSKTKIRDLIVLWAPMKVFQSPILITKTYLQELRYKNTKK